VLEAEPDEIDMLRFERLAREGRRSAEAGDAATAAELLCEALGLWRGAPLADFAYEPFAQDWIGRLEEQRMAALEDRVDADLALGRHAALVGELEALVAAEPLRERTRGQLMLALYRAGRQAEALAVYQRARALLVEELGIEPSPALRRLEAAILGHEAAAAAPAAVEPAESPLRVVLADDAYIVREGLRRLLETQPGIEVVAACADLAALLAAVETERPDAVLTDIRMPPEGSDEGIRAARLLRETRPEVGVVVLSQYAEPRYALALLEDGADRRGYLLKERVDDLEQLLAALRAVAAGGSAIDPKIVETLVAAKSRTEHSALDELTPRERDVLREMAEGRNNAAIAASLVLSERSVEKVIHSVFLKLGLRFEPAVHKRVKAVLVFLAEGRG
jgi:DNA-binding NarL/FixJ family response regulator